MAKNMVAGSARHRNPILSISSLISTHLKNKCAFPARFAADSTLALGTAIGLGLTAVLAEGSRVDMCQVHMHTLLLYHTDQTLDNLDDITHAMTEIMQHGMAAFKILGYPRYYDDFLWALQRLLASAGLKPSQQSKESRALIQSLFV